VTTVDQVRAYLRPGQTVCFTGRMRYARAELIKACESAGLRWVSTVIGAAFLATEKLSSNSSKMTQAEDRGVPIVQADIFLAALRSWSPDADDYLEGCVERDL
jgi:NAD-dependent DNA ligase